ncbi:NUDIX hydrolase [Labrys wisconsinensis]|uniref:8-oxo-dGTP diphosphatase n=1 Tax=Labrys wisconsinensis TaxID=425677 RepID=A0ABU0JAX7_9HYPH|nr:NUDIX hydrolase [Labrys wisconsinensis]MDQ0470429.1 8-oxo-dGTP diphosphatase [Labrys wisconsinensis]
MDEIRPILTVDVVLFTIRGSDLCVALQRRDREPFAGRPALIGGYVHVDEDADTLATAGRVLRDKAGLAGLFLEQLATFSGPGRDPRGWSASVAYYALVPEARLAPVLERGSEIVPVEAIPPLPFDHERIVAAGVRRLRNKGAWSSLPAFLLPEHFTLPQLREIYEVVLGMALNDSAFRRKIDELQVIEPVAGAFSRASDRPARLYRLRQEALQEFNRMV